MDDSPRARTALKSMLTPISSTSGGLDFDKLVEMADQFTSYSVSTSGVDAYEVFDGKTSRPSATVDSYNADTTRTLGSTMSGDAPHVSAGMVQAQRELASVLLSKNASFAQKLVIDEVARLVDASVRSGIATALDSTGLTSEGFAADRVEDPAPRRIVRRTTSSIRSLPPFVRLAVLPLTAPLEIAASAAGVLAPIFAPDEDDRKALKNIQTLSSLLNTSSVLQPTDPTEIIDSLTKLAPDGDLSTLAADPETYETVAVIARRFGATLLRRAAVKLEHSSNLGMTVDGIETRISASAASTLAEVYRDAASVISADQEA